MNKIPRHVSEDAIDLVAVFDRVATIVRGSCIGQCVEGVGAGAGIGAEVGIAVRSYGTTAGA